MPTIISAERNSFSEYFRELFRYRTFVVTLIKRDLKIKYAQTLLGFLWVILQPLTGVAIFTFFFKLIVDSSVWNLQLPYHIYAFSGFIVWTYFAGVLQSAGMSLLNEEMLIKKVYFPRLLLPLSRALSAMFDFTMAAVLMLIIAFLSGVQISFAFLLAPIILIFTGIIALSVAVWLSALTIRFRDFHHFIPYIVNFGIWLTPVFYPSTLIPEKFHWIIYFNPMAGVIELFRWSFFGSAFPSLYFFISFSGSILLFIGGLMYFRKVERLIADYM